MSQSPQQIKAIYQKAVSEKEAEFLAFNKKFQNYSNLRLLFFVIAIVAIYFVLKINFIAGIILTIILLATFLFINKKHSEVEKSKKQAERFAEINRRELAACDRDFSAFGAGESFQKAGEESGHFYNYDLDIFGKGSVFQYLNRTATPAGEARLASWLNQGLRKKEAIESRQEAISDLGQRPKFCQAYEAVGIEKALEAADDSKLIAWLKEPFNILPKTAVRILMYVLPLVLLGLIIASMMLPAVSWYWPLLLVVVHFVIVRQFLPHTTQAHISISKRSKELLQKSELIQLAEDEGFTAPSLQQLQAQLKASGKSASTQIANLASLSASFDQRLNAVASVLLNALLLWDLHILLQLEKWKKEVSGDLAKWFEVVSEIDALVSLGTFVYNHPNFVMPKVEENDFVLEAQAAGHILLNPEDRIDNDFSLKGPGDYALITGANMAGKSTFLRTIGVNLILAMAGAPVCAKSFVFHPVQIFSSIRAVDSIQDAESYFFAELKRLQAIMDRLKAGERLFIIIDEMLRGTNSKDKAKGSRGLIEQLVHLDGIGMIATHDLSLANLQDEYPNNVKNRRFEIEIKGEKLTFDYKLQEGVSQSLNATFLMKRMGILK